MGGLHEAVPSCSAERLLQALFQSPAARDMGELAGAYVVRGERGSQQGLLTLD